MQIMEKDRWNANGNTSVFAAHHNNNARTPLVLVIDDSPTVRKIIETCLRREGYEVLSFPDGVEALRWLAGPDARLPDLVILDIGLPKMDGYEVARRLKSKPQLNNTMIIVLTRRNGTIDKLKARLAGAKGYLTKPFKTQELIKAIQTVSQHHDSQGSIDYQAYT